MDSILDSIVFHFCHLKRTMNAGLPNEQGIGITVRTFVQLSARVAGWFKPHPFSPAGWQGLIGVALCKL